MPEKRRQGRPRRSEVLHREQEKALARLVGTKLAVTPLEPETPMTRLAALLTHYKEQVKREQNPYRSNFTKFRTELCWTKSEAGGGRTALMPDYPYLREMDDMAVTLTPVLIEKSRR